MPERTAALKKAPVCLMRDVLCLHDIFLRTVTGNRAETLQHRTESRVMGLRYLEITGGNQLHGKITVQGSKNAALPILAACMLGEGPCTILRCPAIRDVTDLQILMQRLGCVCRKEADQLTLDNKNMNGYEIKGEEAGRIRSSVLFLGALLGKMGKAVLPYPGGCAIGSRPIDLHIAALEKMGVHFSYEKEHGQEVIRAECTKLHGADIVLSYPSVGATENIILAAVTAEGRTNLTNAAKEPEIEELCAFLKKRGAQITYFGDGTIQICGVPKLYPAVWTLHADRIVAGTYLLAAMATGGRILLDQVVPGELQALLSLLRTMGARVECTKDGILLESACTLSDSEGQDANMKSCCHAVPYIETAPYPGFPTDLQSPLMAVLCRADASSVICEKVFENRFCTVQELAKLGAKIEINGNQAKLCGKSILHAAEVDAPDLRGGAALVIAALAAEGTTRIFQMEYIERGYEDICRDLLMLGAKIQKGEIHGQKKKRKKKTDQDYSACTGGAYFCSTAAAVSGQGSESIWK